MDSLDLLFVIWAFFFQAVLIVHFALRKWLFDKYVMQYGWIVYALALPAALVSFVLWRAGKPWGLWLGGGFYWVWALFGYVVEYVKKLEWRNAIRWSILGPYVLLYLATVMFYWWPLALVSKPLWYVYGVLFVIATVLNVTSHKKPGDISSPKPPNRAS
jgi:hypothetical protein